MRINIFREGGKLLCGGGKSFYVAVKCVCAEVKFFPVAVKYFCAGVKCFPAATILFPVSHLRYAARNVVSRDVGVAPTEWINDFHGNCKTVRGES